MTLRETDGLKLSVIRFHLVGFELLPSAPPIPVPAIVRGWCFECRNPASTWRRKVVRDMLHTPDRSETIGGAPQEFESTVLWVHLSAKATRRVHLLGRPCLRYERTERYAIDPDTLFTEPMVAATQIKKPQRAAVRQGPSLWSSKRVTGAYAAPV